MCDREDVCENVLLSLIIGCRASEFREGSRPPLSPDPAAAEGVRGLGRSEVTVICNRNTLLSITIFQAVLIVISYPPIVFFVIIIVGEYIKM